MTTGPLEKLSHLDDGGKSRGKQEDTWKCWVHKATSAPHTRNVIFLLMHCYQSLSKNVSYSDLFVVIHIQNII